MKRRMILLTSVLLIVSIALSLYFSNKKKDLLSIEDQLPISNLHEHTEPDGTVVQHRHTYEVVDLPDSTAKPPKISDTSYPIQRAWERLDLDFIRRKYQSYTVAELQDKWSEWYRTGFGPNYPHHLDEAYPQDEWLGRNLSLGQPLSSWSDYRMVLQRRIYMVDHKNQWRAASENRKEYMRKALDLPSDVDTWEEYEDAYLKFYIVASNAELQTNEFDPNIVGGTTTTDGTFIPFKENTVYAHINPETGFSRFTGVNLDEKEEDVLTVYGVAPKGITVIYTDEKGNPLPTDTPIPRFYERNMKELAKAQTLLQQQIEEHQLLLDMDVLLDSSESQKQSGAVPSEQVHEQGHSDTHDLPKDAEDVPLPQRPSLDAKRLSPGLELQPDRRTPDVVQHWWTQLEALHGGELPKDLQALREVKTELEKIKKEGEARLKPPPRPERPTPPERSSLPPPNEDD